MRGLLVTATDTGVGKSVLAAAVCAALTARGERVAAFKPAVTGLDEESGEWPPDHELLASAASAGQAPEEIAPHRFGPPASPHLAAELAGCEIAPSELLDGASRVAAGADALVVEGVGGLMVPLTRDYLVRDLARDLRLAVVIAARPGLGTINHTLLTLSAARGSGIPVAGVVITPWPSEPTRLETSNRETIERVAQTEVSGLAPTSPSSLAEAGRMLPLDAWLGPRPARSAPSGRLAVSVG